MDLKATPAADRSGVSSHTVTIRTGIHHSFYSILRKSMEQYFHFSLSRSFPLSLPSFHPPFLTLSLPLSLSPSSLLSSPLLHSFPLPLSLSLSLSAFSTPFLPSLSLYLSLPITLTLSLSLFPSLFSLSVLSLLLARSLAPFLAASLPQSFLLFLPPYLPPSVTHSPSLHLFMSIIAAYRTWAGLSDILQANIFAECLEKIEQLAKSTFRSNF